MSQAPSNPAPTEGAAASATSVGPTAGDALPPGASPRLWNEDLAPSRVRNWHVRSLFAMWMCDVHSIGGYTFAAGLFFFGLVGWQVFLALCVGITIVFFLMNLTGFAGQGTGVPYPVIARISFGVFGANLPAIIRAAIAIAWYGIQTWLASEALVILVVALVPGSATLLHANFLGLSPLGWICFLVLWALQLSVIRRGMETIRKFQDFAGPAIWVVMFALAIYMFVKAGDNFSFNISPNTTHLGGGEAVVQFLAAIALTIAYFSTLLLNFCDFSRFAPDRRTVVKGNFWGLPVNFIAFAVVVVVVTAGSIAVFGEAITDPVKIVERIDNLWVTIVGAITFIVATIGINVVANFVSASYDLANIAPKWVDFRRGGVIASVISIFILPWQLYNSHIAIGYFLSGLGALLGPLFGIIFTDFFLVRRQRVQIAELFSADPNGPYFYRGGWNPKAIAAFVPAAILAMIVALVPSVAKILPGGSDASSFSWFVGVIVGAVIYYAIARNDRRELLAASAERDAVPS